MGPASAARPWTLNADPPRWPYARRRSGPRSDMRFETRHHRERRERLDAGFRPEWRDLLGDAHANLAPTRPGRTHTARRTGARAPRRSALGGGERVRADRGHRGDHRSRTPRCCCSGCPTTRSPGCAPCSCTRPRWCCRGSTRRSSGIVSDGPMPILGQADLHGPVLIVWDAVLAEARHPGSGHNVVFHEFAHRLDMLTGDADGMPPDRRPRARPAVDRCLHRGLRAGRRGAWRRGAAFVRGREPSRVLRRGDRGVLRRTGPDAAGAPRSLRRARRATTSRIRRPAGVDDPSGPAQDTDEARAGARASSSGSNGRGPQRVSSSTRRSCRCACRTSRRRRRSRR